MLLRRILPLLASPAVIVGGGGATATWDPATATAVTLSGGNLVGTNTGTTSADQGAKVASASGKTSGKYYFEVTFTSALSAQASNLGFGVGTTASTYTGMGNNATTGTVDYIGGSIYSNGSSAVASGGGWATGQTLGIAVDLDNRKFWSHLASPPGNWNVSGSGTANPATNVGGVTIPSGTMVPFIIFGGSGGVANNILTANFGATPFIGTVPSGFTSGWPQ